MHAIDITATTVVRQRPLPAVLGAFFLGAFTLRMAVPFVSLTL